MRRFEEAISRKIDAIPRSKSVTGVFLGMTGGLARVACQESTITIKLDGWAPPAVGMPVRVETVNSVMRVSGPAWALPTTGTIKAISGTTLTVDVGVGQTFQLPFLGGFTPTVNGKVVVDWVTGHVLGTPGTYTPPEPPTPPTPKPKTFTNLLVKASDSGRYQTSWWGNDPWASDSNKGAWFYNGRLSAIKGATITRVEIYLPLVQQLNVCNIGLHTYKTRPIGNPSITNLTNLPSGKRSGWVALPTAWGALLAANPNRGIGVTSGNGYNIWRGTASNSMSGALRFAGSW